MCRRFLRAIPLVVLLTTCALLSAAPSDAAKSWPFRPATQPAVPTVQDAARVANPIDAFILARLQEKGISPAPLADRRTLVRRAYFDLLGLPPSPEEVERFVADDRVDAYERLIDRLLASPQYGERWGRHWLDVVRYADTSGFEADLTYDGAWRYRDYVIRSFNADKPYDRFVREQIAGDELWPDDADARTGTALYCVGPTLPESAANAGQLDYEWLTDAADTTGAAFLGLTMGCARCHNHKYDPITQADYFALAAVFAASDRPYPDKVRTNQIKGLNGLLSDGPIPEQYLNDPRATVRTEKQAGTLMLFHRAAALPVRRLHRGELGKERELTPPAVPAVLRKPGMAADLASAPPAKRRAALADWIATPDNPLTARVLVNRVWGWHFGRAIVATPGDFGAQGEPATHPELLDYLAADFVSHGWSIKRLHRQIMLSSTYRARSAATGPGVEIDPQNRFLWHFPRRRLEGEAVRDAMLACAGTLSLKPFGPPVVPPLSAVELTGLFDAKLKWKVTPDPAEHTRRSVYVLVRRTFVHPLFAAFDSPEVMSSCPQRAQTVVPTQALALLNGPIAREQSAAFADRLIREAGDEPGKSIPRAWLIAFGRPMTPAESDRAIAFVRDREAAFSRTASEAGTARRAALAELCLALFNVNEFVYPD